MMDDLAMEGELLRDTLEHLAKVNKWLGGYQSTLGALEKLIHTLPLDQQITLIDIGCGGGDTLRKIADFGRKQQRNFKLIGVDAYAFIINYAKEKSTKYPEISYFSQNVFSAEFSELSYDIALFNLVLHHFSDDEIIRLLSAVSGKAGVGVIVNDLHRSALAYYLFQLVCLTISNPMARDDGLTSILKGFKRKDFIRFSQKLNVKNYVIHWKWAFRYLWRIDKISQ
jgi:2-polyprenyl-3-methyl-5-hydroxy-6-metoxy-1,4-benzoquinol methylase